MWEEAVKPRDTCLEKIAGLTMDYPLALDYHKGVRPNSLLLYRQTSPLALLRTRQVYFLFQRSAPPAECVHTSPRVVHKNRSFKRHSTLFLPAPPLSPLYLCTNSVLLRVRLP